MSKGRSFADAYRMGVLYENLVREHGYLVEVRDESEVYGRVVMLTFRPIDPDGLKDTYVYVGSHGSDGGAWSTRAAYRWNTVFSRPKKEGITAVFTAMLRDFGLENASKASRTLGVRKVGA